MSMYYFYNKIDKCYLKIIICNFFCYYLFVFFFRININCFGVRLSCLELEVIYVEVICVIFEKKKNN